MTGTEKISKTAWITYLISATPLAVLCSGMLLLWIRFLFVKDIGPIEEHLLPSLHQGIIWFGIIALPIAWILGFTIACRLNSKKLRAIPFLLNILPLTGLLSFAVALRRQEGPEFSWMAIYIGGLFVLLAIGLLAALISARQKPHNPNQPHMECGDSAAG